MHYTKDDVAPRRYAGRRLVEVSDEERQAIADRWNAEAAAQPLRDWTHAMAASDADLPRWAEDMIDAYGADALPAPTRARYEAKKALRARKPDGGPR